MTQINIDSKVIKSPFVAINQTFFDGTSREVPIIDVELPYQEGRMIVSHTDAKGKILFSNQSFIDLSGHSFNESIGQSITILRCHDVPPIIFKEMWETIQAGNTWRGPIKNLHKDGCYFSVHTTIVPTIKDKKILICASVWRTTDRKKEKIWKLILRSIKRDYTP